METSMSGRANSDPIALHEPTRELLHGGARIQLQEQPFQILKALLARPGELVTRDGLREQLWPEGTFVDYEHSLNAAMKRLRAALGDDAKAPTYIETLPRRGYRWIAHASPAMVEVTLITASDRSGVGSAFGGIRSTTQPDA